MKNGLSPTKSQQRTNQKKAWNERNKTNKEKKRTKEDKPKRKCGKIGFESPTNE